MGEIAWHSHRLGQLAQGDEAAQAETGTSGLLNTWLVTGGDSRLCINPATQLSDYGCQAFPRPGLSFVSSSASTISQQVAKNLFLWNGHSFMRKGFEAYFTVLIELLWPKERILEMYLNIAQFGDGIYGVQAAAASWFGKPALRLSSAEAALLAAVLPNPLRLHVDRPSRYLLQRREWILAQMRDLGGAAYLRALESERRGAR